MTNNERERYARYLSRLTTQEFGEEWDNVTEDILRKAHKKRKKDNNKIVIEYPWLKKREETPAKKKVFKVRKKKKNPPSLCAKKRGKKKCRRFTPIIPGRKHNN